MLGFEEIAALCRHVGRCDYSTTLEWSTQFSMRTRSVAICNNSFTQSRPQVKHRAGYKSCAHYQSRSLTCERPAECKSCVMMSSIEKTKLSSVKDAEVAKTLSSSLEQAGLELDPLPVQAKPKVTWKSYIWDTFDKSPEERKFLFKLDAVLLTFACLGYLIKYLDQVSCLRCS